MPEAAVDVNRDPEARKAKIRAGTSNTKAYSVSQASTVELASEQHFHIRVSTPDTAKSLARSVPHQKFTSSNELSSRSSSETSVETRRSPAMYSS